MMLNLAAARWAFGRLRQKRTPDIRDMAERTWELCPTETVTVPPAIYHEGALERISALSPWRNWESERSFVAGGRIEHASTVAHLLRDVEVAGAFLYRGAAKAKPGWGKERMIVRGGWAPQRLASAHLASNWAGSHYFANHLLDDLPLAMIPQPGETLLALPIRPYAHGEGYRALLDLPRPPEVDQVRVEKLTLYTDFAQNSFKAIRYREIRRRIRATRGPSPALPGVFLRRGKTGEPRVLANDAELVSRLTARGFAIVDPERLTAQEIVERTLDARIVVGVEGSHLAHAVYTIADEGIFLVLQPPDRFAMTYKEYTDRMDMGFAFLVGVPAEGGFTVDPAELDRMLDRLA